MAQFANCSGSAAKTAKLMNANYCFGQFSPLILAPNSRVQPVCILIALDPITTPTTHSQFVMMWDVFMAYCTRTLAPSRLGSFGTRILDLESRVSNLKWWKSGRENQFHNAKSFPPRRALDANFSGSLSRSLVVRIYTTNKCKCSRNFGMQLHRIKSAWIGIIITDSNAHLGTISRANGARYTQVCVTCERRRRFAEVASSTRR